MKANIKIKKTHNDTIREIFAARHGVARYNPRVLSQHSYRKFLFRSERSAAPLHILDRRNTICGQETYYLFVNDAWPEVQVVWTVAL